VILSASQAAEAAQQTFSDPAGLVRTGMSPVDDAVGGLAPGQCGILAMMEGVGKTSTIFAAAMSGPDPVGIINVEDTADTVGGKALAWYSGVDSRLIRRNRLNQAQSVRVQEAKSQLELCPALFVCHPGARLQQVCRYIRELADRGCRVVYIDYVQKVRGHHEQRSSEVAGTLSVCQGVAFEAGVPLVLASQFSRQTISCGPNQWRPAVRTDRPLRRWLKDSGDLENEARIIVFGWVDPRDSSRILFVLEKSTFGGEGVSWTMQRDGSGSLRMVS